jgi:FdhD protein
MNITSVHAPGISRLPVQKIRASAFLTANDDVAVEEPLEIRLQLGQGSSRTEQPISITMRTPGNDAELAIGFLFTEGIIPVALHENLHPDLGRLQRHFYTSSSCGVCGKSSIEALRTVCPASTTAVDWQLDPELLYSLPGLLSRQQELFQATGGLHAAALFDREGNFIALREDIGRHNALDKLIGFALQAQLLPLSHHILLLSGRACFELIQKAAMAGIQVVAAVGAPSSLAIQVAEENGITLIGFLREERCNVYAGSQRLNTTKTANDA